MLDGVFPALNDTKLLRFLRDKADDAKRRETKPYLEFS